MIIRSPNQLHFDVRWYRVGVRGWTDMKVQAGSPAAAKWALFKLAREAGYFGRFRDFLTAVTFVRELRR